jgi:hypothetical protein
MSFFAAISSVEIVSLMLMSAVGASQLLDSGQDVMPFHQRQKRSRPHVADAAAKAVAIADADAVAVAAG